MQTIIELYIKDYNFQVIIMDKQMKNVALKDDSYFVRQGNSQQRNFETTENETLDFNFKIYKSMIFHDFKRRALQQKQKIET